MEREYDDPEFGTVLLRTNVRSRRISLRVSSGGTVRITLPALKSWQSGIAFLDRNRDWVRKTQERQRARLAETPPPVSDEAV